MAITATCADLAPRLSAQRGATPRPCSRGLCFQMFIRVRGRELGAMFRGDCQKRKAFFCSLLHVGVGPPHAQMSLERQRLPVASALNTHGNGCACRICEFCKKCSCRNGLAEQAERSAQVVLNNVVSSLGPIKVRGRMLQSVESMADMHRQSRVAPCNMLACLRSFPRLRAAM